MFRPLASTKMKRRRAFSFMGGLAAAVAAARPEGCLGSDRANQNAEINPRCELLVSRNVTQGRQPNFQILFKMPNLAMMTLFF